MSKRTAVARPNERPSTVFGVSLALVPGRCGLVGYRTRTSGAAPRCTHEPPVNFASTQDLGGGSRWRKCA